MEGLPNTRHARPCRAEDLSYKIIGERSWGSERPRHRRRRTEARRTGEKKIIVQTIDPRYCRIKCLLEVYLSLASSPPYNITMKET